jgi:hypothetical protein
MAAAEVVLELVHVVYLVYQIGATVGLEEVPQVDTEVAYSCHQASGHKKGVHTMFMDRMILN